MWVQRNNGWRVRHVGLGDPPKTTEQQEADLVGHLGETALANGGLSDSDVKVAAQAAAGIAAGAACSEFVVAAPLCAWAGSALVGLIADVFSGPSGPTYDDRVQAQLDTLSALCRSEGCGGSGGDPANNCAASSQCWGVNGEVTLDDLVRRHEEGKDFVASAMASSGFGIVDSSSLKVRPLDLGRYNVPQNMPKELQSDAAFIASIAHKGEETVEEFVTKEDRLFNRLVGFKIARAKFSHQQATLAQLVSFADNGRKQWATFCDTPPCQLKIKGATEKWAVGRYLAEQGLGANTAAFFDDGYATELAGDLELAKGITITDAQIQAVKSAIAAPIASATPAPVPTHPAWSATLVSHAPTTGGGGGGGSNGIGIVLGLGIAGAVAYYLFTR